MRGLRRHHGPVGHLLRVHGLRFHERVLVGTLGAASFRRYDERSALTAGAGSPAGFAAGCAAETSNRVPSARNR